MVKDMTVADGMTTLLVAVGPGHTLEQAAQMMAERNVGSAVVADPARPGASIFTERDLLQAIATGVDPAKPLGEYITTSAKVVTADTDLQSAAILMLEGRFRHLVVVDDNGDPCGMLSMRDIVRCWVETSPLD